MRVESNRAPVARRIRTDRAAVSSGGRFESHIGQSRATTGPAASALDPVANLESILLLNDIADREEPDTAARRDASTMLDRLDDIRHGLLLGRLPAGVLADLERVARRDAAGISDPQLRSLLDEIVLRARVELAKLAQTRQSATR
ncbi:MAG: flagellar assembly protein FliX [Rhodospirillaceae bacterium]|nr:flagellar assembly protein FliX [Rhodospirillaceae bacterium]MBT6117875.1 flagellar assembly protein FliX [Rhodospirillaceae bacterium]